MNNDPILVEKVFNRTPIKFTHKARVIHGEISGHPSRDLHFYSRDRELLRLFPNGHISLPNFSLGISHEQAIEMGDLIEDLKTEIKVAWEALPETPTNVD